MFSNLNEARLTLCSKLFLVFRGINILMLMYILFCVIM